MQGIPAGIGEAGRDVYLVANGALAPGASPGECTAKPADPDATCSLYRAHLEGGEWSLDFIATLSNLDGPDWGVGLASGEGELSLAAGVSPSGRYLAFMSRRPLSGYDSTDAASGEADEEVFRYDALAGELRCVSCDPAGGRPRGVAAGPLTRIADPDEIWSESGRAALLPEMSFSQAGGPRYQPRSVLDDGRVYFNAFDSLVPADSNGASDAYQYEPYRGGPEGAASDDCTASTGGAASAQALEGGACVSLLSAGTSDRESSLLDVSASGDDAFIYTASPLSVLDEDPDYDIYDARVGGTAARRELSPECLGEACQPAASAPGYGSGASATFRGPGNVREASAKAGRCAVLSRRVKRLSRRARRLRRDSRRIARRGGAPGRARGAERRARRLAHRAQKLGGGVKRCRRATRRSHR